jgi:PPOX class probable F420-dependent enzyme
VSIGASVRETLRSAERVVYQRVLSPQASDAALGTPVVWSVDALAEHSFCLLISRRRDGRMVPTPVWFAVDGDAIVMRSGATDAKVKRVRADPSVLVAACTGRGQPVGPVMSGAARVLADGEARRAERALVQRYGWYRRLYTSLRDPLLDVAYVAVEAKHDRA